MSFLIFFKKTRSINSYLIEEMAYGWHVEIGLYTRPIEGNTQTFNISKNKMQSQEDRSIFNLPQLHKIILCGGSWGHQYAAPSQSQRASPLDRPWAKLYCTQGFKQVIVHGCTTKSRVVQKKYMHSANYILLSGFKSRWRMVPGCWCM